MFARLASVALCASFFLAPVAQAQSSTPASTYATLTPPLGTGSSATATRAGNSTGTSTSSASTATAPDVYLNVPNLSVGRIELDVDNLQADLNLNAQVASLVTINAGVQVGIQKVNLTIADVEAQVELTVRLGHLVDIVNRVFESLDLNPLLISVLNDVTNVVGDVIGAVDGLLGSITQGGTTLSFLVDNLGNIVQEVAGVSTIVGNYATNMTYTGVSQDLGSGNIQKTYSYSPLGALVNIVFNSLGQILQATVVKQNGSSTTSSAAGSTATANTTAAARR